jgi:hypothetical protein
VIIADKSAAGWFIFDIGIVTRTIVPVAQEYGLCTCIPGDTARILVRCKGLRESPDRN